MKNILGRARLKIAFRNIFHVLINKNECKGSFTYQLTALEGGRGPEKGSACVSIGREGSR